MTRRRVSADGVLAHPGCVVLWSLALYWSGVTIGVGGESDVGFNRSVRPILAEKCFRCHGPDAERRKGDLRLDLRESAVRDRNGSAVIRPGVPDESELLARITATDDSVRMPPPESGEPLSPGEISVLRAWIARGAEYEAFWSFKPPRRAAAPQLHDPTHLRQSIDRWVQARLEAERLTPAPPASPEALLRRVTLDLTGLPPTEPELDAFLADDSPDAYERVVERLLASPRFGERQSQFWLDAARYADTNGYFTDGERTMWRWRDGLIAALNANQPFDQFTVEQLAGDLLPEATESQQIASGFNRNHMTNNETGLIDEEYRISYVMDRLETTGTIWLGLTLNCARCHSHKYDSITQHEYYQLLAYFNQMEEPGNVNTESNSPPLISTPTPEQRQRLLELKERQARVQAAWNETFPQVQAAINEWGAGAVDSLPRPTTTGLLARYSFEEDLPGAADATGGAPLVTADPGRPVTYAAGVEGRAVQLDAYAHCAATDSRSFDWERTEAFTIGAWVHPTTGAAGCIVSKMDDDLQLRGYDLFYEKGKLVVHLNHRAESDAIRVKSTRPIVADWQHVVVAYDGSGRAAGVRIYINGELDQNDVEFDQLQGTIRTTQPFRVGRRSDSLGFTGRIDEVCLYDRALTSEEVAAWSSGEAIRSILRQAPDKRTPLQSDRLLRHYLSTEDRAGLDLWQSLQQVNAAVRNLDQQIPSTMVMRDQPQERPTYVLARGQYDQPGDPVTTGVPAALGSDPRTEPARGNRLTLARWLVSPEQPLTPRVIVNRMWSTLFGTGLVKTVNDFGVQGEWPSHPELLDELAVDFVESGWDVKAFYRQVVTSATYRQSSVVTGPGPARDPENRLLARGPRFRLDAETIRDQALAVSGLLTTVIGGPSVKPYQPAGLWEAVSYDGGQTYVPSEGGDLYRRSLYTFWKRQSPPPAFLAWDGPTRETCVVARSRTNTPLQALVLSNDITYVEAARVWAERLLRAANQGDGAAVSIEPVLSRAFRQLTGRRPDPVEARVLKSLFDDQRDEFRKTPLAAAALLQVGAALPESESTAPAIDRAEWGALTTVLQVLFTLDESVTKE